MTNALVKNVKFFSINLYAAIPIVWSDYFKHWSFIHFD